MSRIKVLPERIINKIAAGEVIERPASVVKELIENSLDAGATIITATLYDSGKKLIRIADNGMGMDEEDCRNSILRHATSKIIDDEDLFNINTLGFRGEALASIAAVSQLSIITKQKNSLPDEDEEKGSTREGFNLVVEGGRVISQWPIATEPGTIIEIINLFFNTPAREKFLKSDQVELRHIIETITRYALINPQISFLLKHENHTLISSPAVNDPRDNIASIYGHQLAKEMLKVEYKDDYLKIDGYLAPPSQTRNDKSQQNIYINKRWIRSEEISKAVYQAFHSMLFVNKHPVFILNLEIDPHKIDVNVHPNKTEIKFEQNDRIYNAVIEAIRKTLQQNNLIPELDFEEEQQLSLNLPAPKPMQTQARYNFEQSTQTIFNKIQDTAQSSNLEINDNFNENTNYTIDNDKNRLEMNNNNDNDDNNRLKINDKNRLEMNNNNNDDNNRLKINDNDKLGMNNNNQENNKIFNETEIGKETAQAQEKPVQIPKIRKIPEMKLLGQIHKTFFVAETEGGAFFIDQHAAHERVLYEKFMRQYLYKEVQTQKLLEPALIELSPGESAILKENSRELLNYGFSYEDFGINTIKLLTIPSILGRTQPKEAFFDLLASLSSSNNFGQNKQEEIITRMACRAAVMAGEELNNERMNSILQELEQTEHPYTCPHGRPTIQKTSADELERRFKRR